MRTNPNVEKAIYELGRLQDSGKTKGQMLGRVFTHREQVNALDSAGLLVTPHHERALKACECLHETASGRMPSVDCNRTEAYACAQVGQASLAEKHRIAEQSSSKKPKERWIVKQCPVGCVVHDVDYKVDFSLGYAQFPQYFTAEQARAVAEALNKLEDK